MTYKAVIFDVDGTLVMSEDRNRHVIEALAVQHGGKIEKQDWNFLAGQPEKDIWGWLKEQYPDLTIAQDNFVRECRDGYLTASFNIAARPGMREAVDYFKDKGLRIIAVSNSPKNIIEHSLKMTGLYDDMEFIISAAEDVPHPKPQPDGFLHGVDKLAKKDPSITVNDCIIFEDSGTGVLAAYASGCFTVQIVDYGNDDHEKADAHVHNKEELAEICRTLVPEGPPPLGLISTTNQPS